jgi:hypothetical protein
MAVDVTQPDAHPEPEKRWARGGTHEENRIGAIVIGLAGRRKALRAARDGTIMAWFGLLVHVVEVRG